MSDCKCSSDSPCCGNNASKGHDVIEIPLVSSFLSLSDILGSIKVRMGIGRMDYRVPTGICAIGNPGKDSPVLVTANYKLSFDMLRKELPGVSAWILVIDTKGVNVWCAAGKGTFGTAEVVSKIISSGLNDFVSHRTVVLPQLSAPGVSAYEVQKETGFKVVFGPIRAKDVKPFLENGMVKDEKMRTVDFPLLDRLVLVPVELKGTGKINLAALAFLITVAFLERGRVDLSFLHDYFIFFGSILCGTVFTPMLLPYLPGRAFSIKGAVVGIIYSISVIIFLKIDAPKAFSWLMLLPAVSSFLALNFTGSSTYTSLSGVKKEIRYAAPVLIAFAAGGVIERLFFAFRTFMGL